MTQNLENDLTISNKFNLEQTQSTKTKSKTISWGKRLLSVWENLPLRIKITSLLILGATIPTMAVIQAIVNVAKQDAIINLQESLKTDLYLLDNAINFQKKQLEANANTLALAVEISDINLQNVSSASLQFQKLESLIEGTRKQQPNASFFIITDPQGKTVVSYVQTIKGDFANYPKLPAKNQVKTEFEPVKLKPGIPLGDVPIIESTINLSRPLSGLELINSKILQRLGLDQQANIGLREPKIEGLPELKQPFPKKTFNIDEGKMGFVLMATQPIKISGNQVGTAIVGTLINRNFEIVDRLKDKTGVSTATIFAQDWRVSTNVPYTDKKTRAIGTRVSREVADTVLNKSEVFLGTANIVGIEYLTGYSPLYDHRQQIDPKKAKAVGIAYVGEPQTQLQTIFRKNTLTGYVVGGGILLIFGFVLIVIPSDAGISRQLEELAEFAGKVASAESGVRLDETDRQDEIGILTRNLNEMAQNIDANLETRKQEFEKQGKEKETLEEEIYQLIEELQGAVDGDLTVRASLNSIEMSTVADLFNAIIDSLRDIAIQVKDSSIQVSSYLGENEQSIQVLAQQAIQEAEETRNTLGAVEQMSHSIEEVANNANQAASLAEDAYEETKAGSMAIDETVNSILSLRTTVGETARKMKHLGESSQKINQVVSLIEEIALKTNLLAINAARSGDQGQGFNIFGEQLAKLGEQSAIATREIAQIVADIKSETQEVSEAMEMGNSQAIKTTRLVESTKESLEQVLERSRSINELMQSISQATVSQTDTSGLITQLMQQIAEKSEQRLTSSQEVSLSMQTTAQIAKKLTSAVEKFKLDD